MAALTPEFFPPSKDSKRRLPTAISAPWNPLQAQSPAAYNPKISGTVPVASQGTPPSVVEARGEIVKHTSKCGGKVEKYSKTRKASRHTESDIVFSEHVHFW